jgi:hypothetical protein
MTFPRFWVPRRLRKYSNRYSLVDGIPFDLPVGSHNSPVIMAAFSIDAGKAKALLPGNELHPIRVFKRGILLFTIIDYRETVIGKYIEYSVGIACTYGRKPAPPLLPLIFMKAYKMGQYVFDLPVSTDVSVKGGKGIWGMPKHKAPLNFIIGEDTVSSKYDKDGQFALKVEIKKPKRANLPVVMSAANYCQFRGMLMKSYIYFSGRMGMNFMRKNAGSLTIGSHPRVQPLKTLDIDPNPFFSAFFPTTSGVLDDHFECWFLTYPEQPTVPPEGMESVVNLGLSEEWPPEPTATE